MATDVVGILYPDSLKTSRAKLWKNIPSEWKGITKVNTLGGMQLAGVCWLFSPIMPGQGESIDICPACHP
ncbi:MAG: hypothetical protein J7545_02850 [Roseofilum sp. SBFL]|uniref:hypothetical protein n=1 Tax=Roseofilum sp. SBFL TaxID=2821496 RepID=UPI001B23C8FD|nr:hypothetical protein [Roseofilum sp. SBFL]MBP0040903.1 hypothetical protein [Roseofilum sp. SBFL]